MMRSLRIAVVGALAAIAMAACSSNDGTGTSTPTTNAPAATTTSGGGAPTTTSSGRGPAPPTPTRRGGGQAAAGTITIQNFQFGEPLSVQPGATITVTNKDTAGHNVVADDGSFKTEVLDQNQSGTFTAPTKAGTYKFSCTLHANMTSTGTLVVQG
jgi:plastocyanin